MTFRNYQERELDYHLDSIDQHERWCEHFGGYARMIIAAAAKESFEYQDEIREWIYDEIAALCLPEDARYYVWQECLDQLKDRIEQLQ